MGSYLGTWAGVQSSWALGHLGTWALGHLGTWALLGSWELGPGYRAQLGTWALGLMGSWAHIGLQSWDICFVHLLSEGVPSRAQCM
jgi:hypothetical protein